MMERPKTSDRRELEDLSTLGMDWDNETIETAAITKGENASAGGGGDVDEDDIEADQRKYLEEHAMVVDGYKCPDEFVKILTPMEFEEMVNLFTKFDVDHSNTIDKHETKKILLYLGMEGSIEMAQDLLDIIDVDKSGEIDFNEFCNFIVMLKRGDPRLNGYSSMLSVLNATPLGELERQATSRNLKISFAIIEKREATLTQPTAYIVEARLTGMFHTLQDGEVVANHMVKRFQGIGGTTKEAKYNAATNAIINLGESMPGVRCKEGEFPDEWLEWLNENLLRGVDPGKLVSILASKGFHPHRNITLMHRILTWCSLDRFLLQHPDLDLLDTSVKLHEDFFEWLKETAKRGIDGEVISRVLEDRCIDIKKDHLYFAQKLENNELGSLMDKDGQVPDILDFWHACKYGYYEDVVIYCKCGVNVNEERVDRHTSERTTPLMYASAGGHAEVVRVLLEYGADPKAVDLRGRSAVHHGSLKGHTACCAYLIDGGAMMFAGDIQQNTALHLAAMNNHYDCVNYLAFKSLDITRMITSDKIKVQQNKNFLQLAEEIFHLLPTIKLTTSDSVRFEKLWLNDAANLFISKMDSNVIHMLAPSSVEIMDDVLARFDPRPESGIFLNGGINGEQIFLKTVPNPADLAALLKNTFRQSALDTINNWKRTPLHMACDANHINSHEQLILRMIDFHGCNVSMKDIHGRRPIDLLIKDKVLQNMPTSTQTREELLIDRRATELERLFQKFDADDMEKTRMRRRAILDEGIEQDSLVTQRLWHCLREGALFKKPFGSEWEMYEDPDSGNYFYCKVPQNALMGDTYDYYSWNEPAPVKAMIDRTNALQYLLRIRSTSLRQFAEWQSFRCNKTGIEYYFNATTNDISFVTPKHLMWRTIQKEAVNTKQRLGYGNEWEVLTDKYGHTFYRNAITRQCEYDKPVDAVDVKPAEMLCSAYQHKGKATVQNWYSCEQCNRAWKSSPEGSTAVVKICEPCVVRCHSGHKGIRLIRNSLALCICAQVCKVTACTCNALVISRSQTRVQIQAMAAREELERHRQRNIDQPPVFAMVPREYFDGTPKRESGWMICRLCVNGEPSTGSRTKDDGSLMLGKHGDDASLEEADLSDSESSLQSMSNTSLNSMGTLETAEESKQSKLKDALVTTSGKAGNFTLALPPNSSMRMGLPPGWVELYDVEEPVVLKYEDRVLVKRYSSELRKYATVKNEVRKGFFKVKYDDRTIADEVIERSYIELVSRKKFFCNPATGQAAWSMFQAQSNPVESQSLTLTGPAWNYFYLKSVFRRPFGDWVEMINPYIDQVFYMLTEAYNIERAVLQLQANYRSKFHKARPFAEYMSSAFTFDVPDAVAPLMKERAGWAYLRRRSTNVGEFLDLEGTEWEEYTDKKTSEYFYWTEEANLYQWDKPEVFQRKLDAKELLKEGEDVMYIFPGRRTEEMAVITKVRFDDETGEDMYDLVHKYVPELAYKWVARMHIKFVPKEGDALMLAKLEVKWKQQLRRKREADERKAKRDKELAMAAELHRLEEMKTMAYRMGKREESAISTNTRIIRGRVKRAELEEQEIRERLDLTEGKARRDRIQATMKEQIAEKNLSRSEVLSMTRALELKMKLDDKVQARNALRKDLVAKKKESMERTLYIEETLRDGEIRTTTPRSLVRRRIVRRMHIAMQRQASNFMICEWGCGDWFRVGKEQVDHQLRRCVRRIIGCTLGCPLKHTEEYWLSPHSSTPTPINIKGTGSIADTASSSSATFDSDAEIFYGGSFAERARTPKMEEITVGIITQQQYHETDECPKRLVMCPKQCLEWVCAELMDKHLTEQCTKRPAKPIKCRLGCGATFGGHVETLIQAEDERLQHENEECDLRIVRCTWQFEDGRICAAQMQANQREEHRDYHLTLQGMLTYTVPGTYLYKVPKKLTRLKVQLWGAGGGSGCFRGRQGGAGGGGAFVEAIIAVEPFSVLELVVGSGGGAGVTGTDLQTVGIDEQRRRMAIRRDKEIHLKKGEKMVHNDNDETAVALLIEEECSTTLGGVPGGGDGYGGSGCWASGGGGGYSMISKKTAMGSQALLVAAGGGGGASLNGLPGGALEGVLAGTLLDPLNGTTATVDMPGKGGESGSTYNSAWCATPGQQWQGGNGCEFGAGGGGGYFGGGGGGTMPGISGAGGGGSSYAYVNIAYDHVIVMGHGMEPGGLNHNPPLACGLGEWDKVGGFAGQGGTGDPYVTRPGNNGAIRLTKPGHY